MSRQHVPLTEANVYAELMEAEQPVHDAGTLLYLMGRRQATSRHPDYRTMLAILRRLAVSGKVKAVYFRQLNHTIFYAQARINRAGE